jgi:cytochrome P450
MKMTLRMVTRTLFNSEIAASMDAVADAVKILQRISYDEGQTPLPTWLPLPARWTKRRVISLLDSIVLRIVREGRVFGHRGDDLLGMLLNACDDRGQPLTDQQIRDEVMTVLLAGHESTANAISWMWYLLAQHPTVEARLTEELDRVLEGRAPSISDLKDLNYTSMIVKEALRLYPPAWALPRETIQDTIIAGYPVKKGSLLFGIPFLIQRDARYFDAPEQFHPERFKDNFEKQLPRHVYIPFGGGPRFCVGNTFALLAMQFTLATVHQRFRLSLVTDQKIVLDPLLTLRPRYGIHVRVEARL